MRLIFYARGKTAIQSNRFNSYLGKPALASAGPIEPLESDAKGRRREKSRDVMMQALRHLCTRSRIASDTPIPRLPCVNTCTGSWEPVPSSASRSGAPTPGPRDSCSVRLVQQPCKMLFEMGHLRRSQALSMSSGTSDRRSVVPLGGKGHDTPKVLAAHAHQAHHTARATSGPGLHTYRRPFGHPAAHHFRVGGLPIKRFAESIRGSPAQLRVEASNEMCVAVVAPHQQGGQDETRTR